MRRLLQYTLTGLAVVLLAGCASRYPEPIRTDVTDLTSFTSALRQADALQGQTARWGGVIASVENTEDATRIEVVNFSLNGFGRPQVDNDSEGRFVVYLNRFVDPEIYKEGRRITALGTIRGSEEGKIGEFRYVYPVLDASGVELWREQDRTQQIGVGYYYYDPYSLWYRHSLYGVGPYRYHPYYFPYGQQRPRVQQSNPPRPQGLQQRTNEQ